ncbi:MULTISPECIES: phosphoglucosamine mutase [Corallincola]|uniref:Phosphoglucosamine mutase n=3 Tax=Corallincola TaxID=1775176 RepID=A0A368N381_9GAMM|nr:MULTISPECIES: phosphoglucosamine mutase [Corallincola]RCU44630.1 phosphoglucosamine mutase [Corallincola holothuriorum]TAA40376.1 phosphoglucosamine mutase [Corallincola spongiicola]TCI05312.1 phosphoglucosamine mutase [Corallincola luteus]
MSERKYFGTDGVRGRVGEFPITPEFFLKLGWAAGRILAKEGSRTVLIGKDTRISNYMLESALEAGLAAAGLKAAFTGPMPTPAIAYLARTFRAEAGIVISASHNPFYDNGIKFFSADGTKLDDDLELAIEAELDKPLTCVDCEKLGKAIRIDDAAGRYIEFCKSNFPSGMSLVGMKIVVDCANGATYHIAPAVFSELGAEVIPIGISPDGVNINEKCGATAMDAISKAVVEHQADLGIAFDGDGDRVMMVDRDGVVVDGDELVYIIARDELRNGSLKGGVVGTLMSNLGMEVALRELGIPFVRAKVGDRYVMEALLEKGWSIGGEGSGHIINLAHTSTGDGIVAALRVLTAMQNSHLELKELRKGMKKYPQLLINVRYPQGADPLAAESVQKSVQDAEKALADKGRVLLRKSGTEPLIRVMVEGEDAALVKQCAQQIATQVEESVKA